MAEADNGSSERPDREEQAALRRVAVLVARGAPPEEIFAAVTAKVRRLLDADETWLARYDPRRGDNVRRALDRGRGGSRGRRAAAPGRAERGHATVFETGRRARIEDFSQASGPSAKVARGRGIRSSVGVPVLVEEELWGLMQVAFTSEEP